MNEPAMHHADSPSSLRAAIQRFETRLRELDGGNCAYEKALVRSYEQSVARARELLAALTRA